MPASSAVASAITAGAALAPPPSAYPDPICLPVSPQGDPTAARVLGAAYRGLADDLETAQRRVDAIVADLESRWRGVGSTALVLPRTTIEGNVRILAAAARTAADHLNDYADALERAQRHHGWSLGRFIEVGAIVAVTAAVVVVTVGAAAPVGTLAAVEIGEAIAGTEAAAGAATAAEASATAGLSLTGQSMTAMRGLSAVALPHLAQGGVATTLDLGLHVVTGQRVTGGDLAEAFAAGLVGSATTSLTTRALHATEAYRGVGRVSQAALDTGAVTAALSGDEALQEYVTSGHLDPSRLTRDALLTALTGGVSTLRHPLDGTGAATSGRPAPTGQTLAELERDGVRLELHEGGQTGGHTIRKHISRTMPQLRQRLESEPDLTTASSFHDRATAEAAIAEALRRNPAKMGTLLTRQKPVVVIHEKLPFKLGPIVLRDGSVRFGRKVVVTLILVRNRVVVLTAYVE